MSLLFAKGASAKRSTRRRSKRLQPNRPNTTCYCKLKSQLETAGAIKVVAGTD